MPNIRFQPIEGGVGAGPLEGGLRLNTAFTAIIDDPALPHLVCLRVEAIGRRLAPAAVTVERRKDGPPVTGSALRSVAIERCLRAVRQALADEHGAFYVGKVRSQTENTVTWSPLSAMDGEAFGDGRRRRSPEETLPAVVDAYRSAIGSNDWEDYHSPTAAVGRRLGYSRGHAAKLVSQARAAGLLGQTVPGKAGEIIPAKPSNKTAATKRRTK